MTRLTLCALALATVTGCAQIHTEQDGRRIVHYDEGGSIGGRALAWNNLQVSGDTVEIRGYCQSACTMLLSLQKVCVHPKATLAFHRATSLDGRPHSYHTAKMAVFYPPAVREWFYASGAAQRFWPTTLSGSEVAAMGVALCNEGEAND